MLLLVFALLQSLPGLAVPATPPEQRADLALRRADEGRNLALRYLCQDERRLRQVIELDKRFGGLQTLFARRFSHGWQNDQGAAARLDEQLRAELGRRDDCHLRDSFAAGLSDYENGLLAAQAELGTPDLDQSLF